MVFTSVGAGIRYIPLTVSAIGVGVFAQGEIMARFPETRAIYQALQFPVPLAGEGLAAGDRLLISMPTTPQGVIAFYAANRLGATPALIHPLSTAPEITHYLNASGARFALVLDAYYNTMASATPTRPLAGRAGLAASSPSRSRTAHRP